MTELGTPVQGVTLYSFTRAFHAREFDFTQLVHEVARRGLGPGLEIVGFQSIKGFPRLDPQFVAEFRTLMDDTGLVPTALSVNVDRGLRRDRMLTGDEVFEYMSAQIVAARTLGFPVARVQILLTPDDMERLLPVAERNGVALGLEIHSHQHPKHPLVQALLERYEKLGSPYLGFVPDWGATLRAFPQTLIQAWRRHGVAEHVLAGVQELWNADHAEGPAASEEQHGQRFGKVMEFAARNGVGELGIEMAVNSTGLFGHAPVADWAEVLPWSVHTHGKFYEIDAAGEEPAVPIRELMDLWVRSGYSAAISSEWEGFHWNDWDDGFDVIASQQALIRSAVKQSGSRVIDDTEEARARVSALAEERRS